MTHAESRTYSFETRLPDPKQMMSMSGLDYLRGILAGDFPAAPISATLNFGPTELDQGRAVFEGTPERYTYNPLGTVHGGWAATILDSAMGCAVHTTLPVGVGYTTLELKLNYVRAVPADAGELRAEGTVIHAGGTVATAEGRLTAASDGRLLAHATTTCLIMRPR